MGSTLANRSGFPEGIVIERRVGEMLRRIGQGRIRPRERRPRSGLKMKQVVDEVGAGAGGRGVLNGI